MFKKYKNIIPLLLILLIKLSSSNTIIERLTGDTQPVNYNLVLSVIDLKSDTFTGIATIQVLCTNTTNVIKLHSENLRVKSVKLVGNSGISSFSEDGGFLTINLSPNLLIHETCTLTIRYTGLINNDLTGLYRTSYLVDGIERVVAATFMAPNFARRVFPCYDEPGYKSTFELVVRHTEDYHVLANTQIHSKSETIEDETLFRTEFIKTPKMSSYLLAFTITDFVSVAKPGSIVNVYVQPFKTSLVKLALDFGGTSLAKLEEYLNGTYQTSKMDFILFDDFLYGAMENWGLITYHSSRLYYDPDTYSINQYYQVLKIITHELAHQWFGNEVTCSWWSYTWLNEGFATFMEDYILNLIYPEMRNMDIFLIDTMQEAMRQDVPIDIKPMNNIVENTDQLSTVYDFIAYKKSGSVIRMIETFVTPNVFQEVIRNYVVSNSYAAASPLDVYRSFEQILHDKTALINSVNITELFSSWTENPGYPILNVWSQFNNGTFEISQQLFLANGSVKKSNFMIPTTYTSNGKNITEPLLIQSPFSLEILTQNNTKDWVLFNVDSNGYYRVNYDLKNWKLLIKELNNTGKTGHVEQIKAINRAQLIDDAFNLAKYNYLTYNVSIDMFDYLKNEVDLIPIKAALKHFDFMFKICRGDDNNKPIMEFIHSIIRPLFLKFNATQPVDKVLRLTRMEVFTFACKVGLSECVDFVKTKISAVVTKNIDADIRLGYFYGLARANPSNLVEYLGTLLATRQSRYDNIDELNEVIAGLAFIDDDLVPSVLSLMGEPNNFELTVEERQRILEAFFTGDNDNIEKTLNFIRDNYSKLGEFNKPQLFTQISNNIVTVKSKTLFDDIVNKLTPQLSEADRDELTLAQRSTETNLKWINRNIGMIIERIQYKPENEDNDNEEEHAQPIDNTDNESTDDDFPIHYVIIGVLAVVVIIALVFVLRRCCRK